MARQFSIDGVTYDADALSAEGQVLVERLQFVQVQMQNLSNQQALLNKARKAYIADLRGEIVQERTGINLGELFSDES